MQRTGRAARGLTAGLFAQAHKQGVELVEEAGFCGKVIHEQGPRLAEQMKNKNIPGSRMRDIFDLRDQGMAESGAVQACRVNSLRETGNSSQDRQDEIVLTNSNPG